VIEKESVMGAVTDHRLIAWETHEQFDMDVEPAVIARDWMDETNNRNAYRCLPLVIANQAGWVIRNPVRFCVRWNGGPRPKDVRIWYPRGQRDSRISSHFGEGVLTVSIPYLFRTPPGVNLWVKGPANMIKDGIQPLEGVVEADWTESTFTMNWKLTRPNLSVRFERAEPICMIVPIPRALAESLDPVRMPLGKNGELQRAYQKWEKSRRQFNQALKQLETEAVKSGWQRDYMLGRKLDNTVVREHQTKLALREFRREC
jgi:uncharacterized protein DUF6065